MDFPRTVTIVGVGLLGGSLGRALRERGLVDRVIGVGHSQPSLDIALAAGAVTEATLDPVAGVREAGLVVCCTPVERIPDLLRTVAAAVPQGALLTDVGSTKARIAEAVPGKFPRGVRFVGSHPLAGGEKSGAAAARADLFVDRLTVVTPTAETDPADAEFLERFWQAVGCRTLRMSPADHDAAVAATSHVPHLTAAALAASLPTELFPLAARGFRDTTRIAAGSPELWRQIVFDNRAPILAALDTVLTCLEEFRAAIAAGDQTRVTELLTLAKRHRDALGS